MFVLPSREQLKQINVLRRIYSGSDGKIRREGEKDEAQAMSERERQPVSQRESCVTMIRLRATLPTLKHSVPDPR